MALTVTQDDPIVVTGDTAASAAITTADKQIIGVYWYAPTTIGHKLALQDGTGRELIELQCVVANQSQYFPFPDPIHAHKGIYSDDMDSGTLYLYIK